MAVTKPYTDYNWYADSFMGTIVSEQAFPTLAMKASYLVDNVTAGNMLTLDEVPDCVKDAICAVAEQLYQQEQNPGKNLKSESNDGYSVTYADSTEEKVLAEAKSNIRMYLSSSGLLYRGCRRK